MAPNVTCTLVLFLSLKEKKKNSLPDLIYIFPSSASLFQEEGGWRQSRILHPVGGGHPTPGPLGESRMWLPVPFVPSVSCRTRETPPEHLYPLPPSLAPAGNPVPPLKASRSKLKRPREAQPPTLCSVEALGTLSPLPMVVCSQAPSFPPP